MLRDATTHVLAAIMVNVATTSNTTTAPINQQDFFFANETNLESMSLCQTMTGIKTHQGGGLVKKGL